MMLAILRHLQASSLRIVWCILVGLLCIIAQPCRADIGAQTMRTGSTLPLAARNITGGMTSDQTVAMLSPRRVIINDDDGDDGYDDDGGLRPGYDPQNPGAPIGDIPWLLMLVFCIFTAVLRTRQSGWR